MDGDASEHFVAWKTDMKVIYVCLDVVPHYEARNPAFGQALTRLWCEVDLKNVEPASFNDIPGTVNPQLLRMLTDVAEAIGEELRGRLVFVGGCTTALFITDPVVIEQVRFTDAPRGAVAGPQPCDTLYFPRREEDGAAA